MHVGGKIMGGNVLDGGARFAILRAIEKGFHLGNSPLPFVVKYVRDNNNPRST
jgi:hypothetical protein